MGTFQVGRHLERCSTEVDGRSVSYSVGGHGFPVVFLHGWGLAEHSYKRALNRLVVQGCRVYAPTLPGFGGSADLPQAERTIAGYANWTSAFMREVGISEPALVVGHSFGGGVAIKLAHEHTDCVRYLVLMNSVGATPWGPPETSILSALNRPGWLWALRALRDPLPLSEGLQVMRAAAEDLVPNLVRHPRTMLEVGLLARTADLGAELEELGRRELPVLVLWGDHDRVLPVGSFEALCRAIGTEGQTVPGNHSWILADPDAFGEVMSNVVEITARRGTDELHSLLDGTSMPDDTVKTLLADAAPLWLMSDPPPILAADLALCHPPLGSQEVRAVARAHEDGGFRLTVVAHDRQGLLADTTAVLAAEGLSVNGASATTWTAQGLAMHSLTVDAPPDFLSDSWDLLARRLRSVTSEGPGFLYEPGGRAHVRTTPQTLGRSLLSITAPDQLGLLWRICDWLADHDVTIEAARVTSTAGTAHDEFIVVGRFDPISLEEALSTKDVPMWRSAVSSVVRGVRVAAGR